MEFSAEIRELLALPLRELMQRALEVKLARRGTAVSLCSIINAKSGKCTEDCRFCVQSGHFRTNAPIYSLLDADTVVRAALEARKIGAMRFSIVTSGRGLPAKELSLVAAMVRRIRDEAGIEVCASLGILKEDDFRFLKDAGLSRYHHNLETSAEYFPRVVSTHSFADRVETIEAAQKAGLDVCAGGIFGLGESVADRVSMGLSLKECGVASVPINILVPLPGTPLADAVPLEIAEILRAISIYRLIMPGIPIRLAAGRESVLKDFLSAAFMAGADGLMIGGYLTQKGRSHEDDHRFVEEIKALWSM